MQVCQMLQRMKWTAEHKSTAADLAQFSMAVKNPSE
jgi:hypothetical protein